MVSDFNTQESYHFFLEEVTELLQILEDGLLNLSPNYSLDDVYNLMRTAHSIKGGSALVGLTEIENLAHKLESIFKLFYESKTQINSEIESLLLEAYNCLRSPLVKQIKTGKSHGEQELITITKILKEIERKIKQNTEKQSEENRENINFEDCLFANEIKQGLNRLEIILGKLDAPETPDAFKAQIKILHSLAELSEIPDLLSITESTNKMLEDNPKLVFEIGKNTLEKLRSVCESKTYNQNNKTIPLELNTTTESINELAEKPDNIVSKENVDHSRKEILEQSITVNNDNDDLTLNLPTETPLPIGSRLDLIALNNISDLFSELIIIDNLTFSYKIDEAKIIKSLKKWLSKIAIILSDEEKSVKRNLFSSNKDKYSLEQPHININEYLSQLKEIFQDLELLNQSFFKEHEKKQKKIQRINHHLIQARMIPIRNLLKQFPRLIKELALKQKKQVKLVIQGDDILIDKLIIEKLYNPLIHLLRNAIVHGLENPDIREKQEKNVEGQITIHTYKKKEKVRIEISDDGQGIKLDKIRNLIKEKKLLNPQELKQKSEQELYQFLFENDFSTAENINNLSGRGMGLSIVKNEILALKGNIKVKSEEGLGTTFILEIPLSMSLCKLLIFKINGQKLAIPFDNLKMMLSVTEKDIKTNEQGQFYQWNGKSIPLYPDFLFFSYNYPSKNYHPQLSTNTINSSEHKHKVSFPLLVIADENQIIALKTDTIITQQESVIKPFNKLVKHPSYLTGCTMLTNGELIPVLYGKSLIEKFSELLAKKLGSAAKSFSTLTDSYQMTESPKFSDYSSSLDSTKIPTILVVDDSLKIRQSLSFILQKNGYKVIQAQDGWEALTYLERHFDIQAVISDIEMPRMNGLEFLSHCRQSEYQSLPVIMLTSRSSEKYRILANKLGADEYLTKPYLDKELLGILKNYV